MNKQNNCTKYRENIAALVLGVLEPKDTEKLQKHLETCQNCKAFYEAMLNEEDSLRSGFQEISQKGEVIQNSLIEKLKENEEDNLSHQKIIKINKNRLRKNPLIKFAAAAVIIIAVLLIFNNGPVITTPAFGFQKMIDEMQKAKWIHSVMTIVELNWDEDEQKNVGDKTERWQSVNPSLSINVESNGKIIFQEENSGKISTYNPESNIITEEYKLPSDSQDSYNSISDMFRAQIADINDRFDQVKYEEDTLDGQPVTRIILDVNYASEKDGLRTILSIAFNPDTYLPLQMTIEQSTLRRDKSGKIIVHFDYPNNGPRDIYEAGAPRDAEVVIVDKRGNPETIEALEPYKKARENFVSKYIMISTVGTKSINDEVLITYMDGRKERRETHYIFKPGDAYYEMWPVYSAAMGTTFDSILKWTQQYKAGSVTIRLYDGQYEYGFEKDDADKWTAEEKQYRPDNNPIGKLAEWGWPFFSYDSLEIENEYSIEHGLLCFEKKTEANIENDILIEAAQREFYYLDPQHDYILVRQEKYGHRTIEEKPAINEINFDPNEIPTELFLLMEVVEFGQTNTGQWYPEKIKYHSRGWNMNGELLPLRENHTITILLETDRELPPNIFESTKVIPEDSQNETSTRKSYDEIVKEAIASIDARPVWPSPRELVEAYWQARNKKDYDTMALYWPGSSAWNENLADETPVKYVFAEVEYLDSGGAYVPYALENTYLQNGMYNLNMWLKNDKSTKGRYYIISGN